VIILTLRQGNLAKVIRYFPTQALNFAFNEKYKKLFVRHDPQSDFWKFFAGNLVSGGAAGATSLFFVYPVDLARIRLAADLSRGRRPQYNGLIDCMGLVYANGGFRGLYGGIGSAVGGVMAYRAVFFGGYDTAKGQFLKDPMNPPIIQSWLFAQAATTAANMTSYPFDVVRYRMMMQARYGNTTYRNTLDCWYKILIKEGPHAFYKGASGNLLPSLRGALVLVLYDQFQRLLRAEGGLQ
jgi:solute carrier family 25 (mitochondrial adenine nucleotide translocator), member 4/5/6/31